jgi:hypothetical protein
MVDFSFGFAGEEKNNILVSEINLVRKAIQLREMEHDGKRNMTLKESEFVFRVFEYLKRHPQKEIVLDFAVMY